MLSKYAWIGLFCLLLLVVVLPACSGGGSTPMPALATVNGCLLDSADTPIVDAVVTSYSDSIEARTDTNGLFSIAIAAGAHHLVASKNGTTLAEICMTAAEGVIYELGDIKPDMVSTCAPGTPSAGDIDGDGLMDADESAGWTVNLTLGDGTVETRQVDSDIDLYDTDGDGLNDAQEMAARTDPRRIDTDGDLLSDYAELNVYKSQPTRMDSDGDSCDPDSAEGQCDSDPNLWDGYELTLSSTSPTLADTDGDGLSDYQEINVGGTNPLIADLPDLSLELNGEPSIILNITDTTSSTDSKVSSSLKSNKAEQKKNSTASTDLTVSNTTKIHAEAEAGTGKWPPSASVKATNDTSITAAFSLHTDTSFTKDSVQETKDSYETEVGKMTTVNFDDGMLWVAIKLKNTSSLAFKFKDLKVIAYRMEPDGSFSTVGTLIPGYKDVEGDRDVWMKDDLCSDPNDSSSCGRVLGPSDELTLVVGADALPAQIMRALVANPTALRFEVASYSLFQLDEWGVNETVNYAKLNESVVQRCGLLAVDYGDGAVLNKMVAANVYRNPDGSGRGVTLREALSNIIDLDYETLSKTDTDPQTGDEVLYRIKNTRAYDKCDSNSASYDPEEDCTNLHKMGLWLVGGSDRQFDDIAPPVDFNDLVLNNNEQINLVYVQDSDGEGIFDREEYLLGTDNTLPDSDYDGLSDYEESKVGWQVAVDGKTPYEIFPDPRFSDIDGDFLSDITESYLGTDPYNRNTDGDNLEDTTDPFPLSPPCLAGDKLNMVAWWDGSSTPADSDYVANDIWSGFDNSTEPPTDLGVSSIGMMYPLATNLAVNLNGDPVFSLNPDQNRNDQFVDVPLQDNDGLSPHRELTISALFQWDGTNINEPRATVLSKGGTDLATYALSIRSDGKIKFSLYRNAKRKCWEEKWRPFEYYWNDSACPDSTFNVKVDLVSDVAITAHVAGEESQFVKVTATFSGETMSLYVDEKLAGSRNTESSTWTSGDYRYQDTITNYLVDNNEPLRIGGEFRGVDESTGNPLLPQWPFRGMMDDVQVFSKGLNAGEAGQLSDIGVCVPTP